MYDLYNRNIDYLRISVTDRCNLRCTYCMPPEGIERKQHSDILTYEEIVEIANCAVSKGIKKIRLTGGEPLVRKGIINLVSMLSKIEGLQDLSMTTNGILLDKYAQDLANAGLNRVNISLDTLGAEEYRKITRGGDLQMVLDGIKMAQKVGLKPIKINCVVQHSKLDANAQQVEAFCKENGLQIRFIKQMNLNEGIFSVVDGGAGGNCDICNRLRLTSDGKIRPCLFSDLNYDTKTMGIENAINSAIANKPKCGNVNTIGEFYTIGG